MGFSPKLHHCPTQVLALMLTNNMNLKVGLAGGKNMNTTTMVMVNIETNGKKPNNQINNKHEFKQMRLTNTTMRKTNLVHMNIY